MVARPCRDSDSDGPVQNLFCADSHLFEQMEPAGNRREGPTPSRRQRIEFRETDKRSSGGRAVVPDQLEEDFPHPCLAQRISGLGGKEAGQLGANLRVR